MDIRLGLFASTVENKFDTFFILQGWYTTPDCGGEVRASNNRSQVPRRQQGSAHAAQHGSQHCRVSGWPLGHKAHEDDHSYHTQRCLRNRTTLQVRSL